MTLADQVKDLQAGTTSSAALVAAALAGAQDSQPRLHAFLRMRPEAAAQEAAAADEARGGGDARPLLGVPLAVKDNHAVAGEPAPGLGCDVTTTTSLVDDPWVAALRTAGCVVIGQTTMPPLALLPWGPARNPADPTRMAGGSSSGSGAAVAANIVSVATASDGGGSIRIPAALCGLFGFKPAQGLVPGQEHWHGLSTSGVLTSTAQDTALVLDATGVACEAGSWVQALGMTPDRLRVGWTDAPATPLGRPSRELVTALADAVGALRVAGHWADPVSLKLADAAPALSARLLRGSADDLTALRARVGAVSLPQPARLMTAAGARIPDSAVAWARRRGEAIRERMRALPFDVLLTPTVPSPARVQDDARLTRPAAVLVAAAGASWTGVWNAASLPAVSVPVGHTPAGLPLSVQLVDLRGDGHVLFALSDLLTGAGR